LRLLRFDGLTGVAGDIFVGALLDLGVSWKAVSTAVYALGVESVKVRAEKVVRRGVSATKFHVLDRQSGRPVEEVRATRLNGPLELIEIIEDAPLAGAVKTHAREIITRLADAEAKVHAVPFEQVHFHEVGALDTLVDAVAAAAAWCELRVDIKYCSSSTVRVGSGEVATEHGTLPVPAPATVELLRGVPIVAGELEFELTTPTGAAILTHFCRDFGPCRPLKVTAVGYGAGSRELKVPNVFRAILGESFEGA
jgi:hypothetical protein